MKCLNTLAKGGMLVAFMLLFSNFVLAQRTVKGKVTDAETGEGLIGATVTVVGTTRGAVTDIDGNYSVEIPEGSTQLRFAYTGYTEEVVTLSSSNVVEVAMKPGTVLDEVVVVGYGTLKSREVTSAVASLKKEDFNQGNITSAAQLIQGKVAGVSISRPGSDPNGNFAIRLRGLSSLSNVGPLVVVDGIPGVDLRLIDPNDIASIDILKDGSAAAIYGTRASAGVILISTKRGEAGRTQADYNGSIAFDQVARRYKTLSAAEFIQNGGEDLSPGKDVDTDWFNEITQTGKTQIHNLSMSGGMGKGSYRVSFNLRDVEGILRNSGLTQYNAGLNFNQKVLNDRLTLSGSLAVNARNQDFSFLEAFRYSVINNPTAEIKSSEAEYIGYDGYVEKALFDYFNPVAMIEQNVNKGRENRLLGSFRADLEVLPNLTASLLVGQERFSINNYEFYSKQAKFRGRDRNGLGLQSQEGGINNTLESTLQYKLEFGGKSTLNLLGGYSFQEFDRDGFGVQAGNIISDEFGANNMSAFLDFRRGLANVGSYKNQNTLIAFFGRATFNFDDTYFATAGVRREGSTRFGPENKWGLFPFVSAGANLEKILDLGQVDQLKLRVGYGVTGAQPDRGNLYRLTFSQGDPFFYNGNYVPSYGPSYNANPNLKWEEKGELGIGLDYAFAGYKITGALDFYNRSTKDLIIPLTVPVPPNFARTTFDNVATLNTTGFEATVNFNNIVSNETFKWTPGLVFQTYKISVDDFNSTGDTVRYANIGAPGLNSEFYSIVYNGAPVGQLWGPVRQSVNSDGTVTYKDIDGNGKIEPKQFNRDQTKIGNGVPKFELGFNNTFTFGKLDLNFFLRGVFGHDLANEYRVFYEGFDPTAKTWNKVKTDFFDPNLKAPNFFDDTHVERASFLRLDNATLGYNFGMRSSSWFRNARVYLNAQNLFTITKYSGVDPESRVGDTGSVDNGGRQGTFVDPLAPGIDRRSTYFLARTISLGVNFGF